ncbi:MAG: hypothetical protein WDN69_14605 [Aliidongia sp.]
MAAALPAAAQDAVPAQRVGTTAQIEEITVTARRHEEDVQKVPIAISAVSERVARTARRPEWPGSLPPCSCFDHQPDQP